MSMIQSDLLLGQEGGASYTIARSLRFNSSDSAYCSRVFSSAGNRKTWTWAGWVKRSALASSYTNTHLFGTGATNGSPVQLAIYFQADSLQVEQYQGSGTNYFYIRTSAVFRDLSAWYHVVVAWDTTQGTDSNRVKIYVNGALQTQLSVTQYPTQDFDGQINAAVEHRIGSWNNGFYFSGYLADIHFIDGQALTPSSFTEVSATTGRLEPKAYSGPTPTGNSFWLPFSDNSAATATTLGKDGFLLGNNWNPVNVSVANGAPASVASASGALPIYNTTDTYGGSLGSGVRSDPNASYLVLAVPMNGSNGGTSFSDQSPSGRTSSLKTFTNTGTTTSTSQSKYYGSSGYFNGSSFLQIPSNSDFYLNGAFTVEVWCYPTLNASSPVFFVGNWNNNEGIWLGYSSTGTPYWSVNASGTGTVSSNTALRYNSWNHLAFVSTGTGGRNSIYLNGALVGSAPHGAPINNTSNVVIGAYVDSNYQPGPRTPMTGYLQDLRVYKGIAKYTSDFNPPSATANPTAAAGFDTPVDTPTSGSQVDTGLGGQVTGNYATLNPLAPAPGGTLSDGNLAFTSYSAPQGGYQIITPTWGSRTSTIAASSGKWYFEVTPTADAGNGVMIGVSAAPITDQLGSTSTSYGYLNTSGEKINSNSGSSYGATWTNNDVIGCALDIDGGTVTFYKNGVSQGVAFSSLSASIWFLGVSCRGSTTTAYVNFGQRPFAYPVSGYKCLCDTSLPAPVNAKPNTLMDVALWTGNGGNQSITLPGGFNPDLVWVKSRSNTQDHYLFDAVRGGASILRSNTTGAESTGTTYLSFDTSGFSSLNGLSSSGYTYAGWCFDAGSNTVSNTAGSITSQVRANASAGFSVVTYTGNGTNGATVGHGLSVTPSFIIVKSRSAGTSYLGGDSGSWYVAHAALGTTDNLLLNSTAAAAYRGGVGSRSSTTFTCTQHSGQVGYNSYTVQVINTTGSQYVAYCFSPVAGYSSMGSYVGNGSADGPFVYTGFRPRWVLIKNTSTSSYWNLWDAARDPYNLTSASLFPNASDAEASGSNYGVDFTSNGFKIRTSTAAHINGYGNTIIYCAFAESPFQYSRAR